MTRPSKWLIISLSAVILAVLFLAIFLTIIWQSYQQSLVTTNQPQAVTSPNLSPPSPTPDPDAPYGILLLGYGGAGHDGGALTDTIILALISPKQEQVDLISIPRDLWVELPFEDPQSGNMISEKINAAYALGNDQSQYHDRPTELTGEAAGGATAMRVVSQITGFPVKYFIAVDFRGFENAIDTLGGIDVPIKLGFDDPYYPIAGEEQNTCGRSEEDIIALSATLSGDKLNQQFPCRYEHIYFDAGTRHMDGPTALKFARSRHSSQSGSDFARASRQQAVIQAVKSELISVSTLPKLATLVTNLSSYVQTNIDPDSITQLATKASQLSSYQVNTIVLSESNVLKASRSSRGQYILVPASENNWHDVHEFLKKEIE